MEILDFIRENKGACTAFAVIALVCLFGTWFCHDYFRNEPIHSDTDSTMVRMEERIDGLERRLDSVSARIDRLRKPSTELVQQLQQAEKMLKLLQEELTASKNELTLASSEAADLRISLKKLKEQIEKERKVQRRQLWQNRFWCLLIGAGIGVAASR